jgi:hypothetical protein
MGADVLLGLSAGAEEGVFAAATSGRGMKRLHTKSASTTADLRSETPPNTPLQLAARPTTALRSGDFGSPVLIWSLPVEGRGQWGKCFVTRGNRPVGEGEKAFGR